MRAIDSDDDLPADFGLIDGCCPDVRDKRIAELEAALWKAIDYCDAATHGDAQYADERSGLIRVWRGNK